MKWCYRYLLLSVLIVGFLNSVSASYSIDFSLVIPNPVYIVNESIELKGYVHMANNSASDNASYPVSGAGVVLNILNSAGSVLSSYNLTTDSSGNYYSNNSFLNNGTVVRAPNTPGFYNIRAKYTDPGSVVWLSVVEIEVVNQTLDEFNVFSDKAVYNALETAVITAEALRIVGGRILYTANVSMNITIRNATDSVLGSYNCTTGATGSCSVSLNVGSTYGEHTIDLNNFKAFSKYKVSPFEFYLYVKDHLGQSLKNTFSMGEQASVEVVVPTNESSSSYTFSGYITNASGSNIMNVNATTLNSNNSFTNRFVFTVSSSVFSYGVYRPVVTVTKTGDGSISATTSFEVRDWSLAFKKKDSNSGFEYEYSAFPNSNLSFEIYPKFRVNGSMIANLTRNYFNITLSDKLGNIISSANASWNSTCGSEGCYEFSFSAPVTKASYGLSVTLGYGGDSQNSERTITVIDTVLSAQSTNDGNIKELFGTNEFVFITLSAYNLSGAYLNLSDAEILRITFMNGSQIVYTKVNGFDNVNISNSVYEWAWNATSQKFKMDPPKAGGTYTVTIAGNNNSAGATAKFIVNPYDVCLVAKNTAGDVSGSGYYYVWQFKTSDTVYYELTITQANNPTGKAVFNNSGSNGSSSYGMGSACSVNTQTKQVESNATIIVEEVRNTQTGRIFELNTSVTVCQASNNQGKYTCTIKGNDNWDGGQYNVRFKITGQDGETSDVTYGLFESRAFYLYGWSQNWESRPNATISLSVYMYEAGNSWWGSFGSGGLSGSVSVEKVEYMGDYGEWIWPPITYNYTNFTSATTSISNGQATLSLRADYAEGGSWKSGNYRAVLKGTDSAGNTDYGYAWFSIKLWNAYASPVECTVGGCNYKGYFNSRENITLYVRIMNAGDYYDSYGGRALVNGVENVTISVKKVEDCRKWPCKELNASQYWASNMSVNQSNAWYWGSSSNNSRYFLFLNSTSGTWGTGWYSVVLNINGTETGYGWYNTIAFYVDTRPTDVIGSNWLYNIKPNQPMYFNISAIKSQKNWYWSGGSYSASDFVNVSVDSLILRTWDRTTWQSIEYNYPASVNVLPRQFNGTSLLNVTYTNGSWPTGYYWGELTLRNLDNETSNGWLWFNVQPFRVDAQNLGNYENDADACVNMSLSIYEPGWYSNTPLASNYTILQIYENSWSYSGSSVSVYTNWTNISFVQNRTMQICPNAGSWGSGSWGGYHYLNIIVKDVYSNSSETGWLSFRAVPFSVSWGSVSGNVLTTANVNINATVRRPTSLANTTGNLSSVYQWRWDELYKGKQNYNFSVGSCYSWVSGSCIVNGTQQVTVYAPTGGWRVGYNYLDSVWTSPTNANSVVQSWGIYFNGMEGYSGSFSNSDANGNYKYDFTMDENVTIKLGVTDVNYANATVNVTSVQYAAPTSSCWDEWCRTYTTASLWSLVSGGVQINNGVGILNIAPPSGGWGRGIYTFKVSVSGPAGTGTIKNGQVNVKNLSLFTVRVVVPEVNSTKTGSSLRVNAATSVYANCIFTIHNFNNSWWCSSWSNSSNSSSNITLESFCNASRYGYNGETTYWEYVSNDYRSWSNSTYYEYLSGIAGIASTNSGTNHSYTFNLTKMPRQHYGVYVSCWSQDYVYVVNYSTFYGNGTTPTDSGEPNIAIGLPANITYNATNVSFSISVNEPASWCGYSLDGAANVSMWNLSVYNYFAENASMSSGSHYVRYYCNDTSGNMNVSGALRYFSVNTTDIVRPSMNAYSPIARNYSTANISINFSSSDNFAVSSRWFYNGTGNTTYTTVVSQTFPQGYNVVRFYCNDTSGNLNDSVSVNFFVDSVFPLISFGLVTANTSSTVNQTWVFVNVSVTELNVGNITYTLRNLTSVINTTRYTSYTNATRVLNWTGLPYTTYLYNVSVYDWAGNFNYTETRNITLDVTA